jgi:hypothetical protein
MTFLGVGFFFLLMDPFRHLVGLLGWGISPAPRPLPTEDNTIQKRRHTSMPRAGFEPAISMFERPKTVLSFFLSFFPSYFVHFFRIFIFFFPFPVLFLPEYVFMMWYLVKHVPCDYVKFIAALFSCFRRFGVPVCVFL